MKFSLRIAFKILISVLIYGCQSKVIHEAIVSDDLELTRSQLSAMDISIGPIQYKSIKPVINVTGKVTVIPNSLARVSSNITGKVEKVLVEEGDNVKKGQPLLLLNSMELIELQEKYVHAHNEVVFLSLEYQRKQELRKRNIGALAEFQETESKYRNALNTEESIGEKLKLLNINLDHLKSAERPDVENKLYISSPINGSIFKLSTTVGMNVETNMPLIDVINVDRFHAEINVYEKDVDQLEHGQEVEIEFINQSIPKVRGRIIHIIKSIDAETRAVPVIVDFVSPPHANVLPEMAIQARILGRNTGANREIVPFSALIQEGELNYIYYTDSKGEKFRFKKCRVLVGENDGEHVEISHVDPIPYQSRIALTNVYMIDAENKKRGQL